MCSEQQSGQVLPQVLIVDDNDLMRTVLRSILREGGYQVLGEARNGVVAMEMVQRLRPEVICMDVVMPEMDGVEALQAIKMMRPETVVIMITGTPSVDTVRASIAAGASGFIIKPFNSGKVLDTIDRAWRSTRQTAAG